MLRSLFGKPLEEVTPLPSESPNRPLVGLKPVNPGEVALERVAYATTAVPRRFRLGIRKAGSRVPFWGCIGFRPPSGGVAGIVP